MRKNIELHFLHYRNTVLLINEIVKQFFLTVLKVFVLMLLLLNKTLIITLYAMLFPDNQCLAELVISHAFIEHQNINTQCFLLFYLCQGLSRYYLSLGILNL